MKNVQKNAVFLRFSERSVLEIYLQYPLLLDIWAYNNIQTGFNTVRKNFNGLNELLKRKDLKDNAIKKYSEVLSKQDTFEIVFIEILLSQSELITVLRMSERDEVLDYTSKYIMQQLNNKNDYGLFDISISVFLICQLTDFINNPSFMRDLDKEQYNAVMNFANSCNTPSVNTLNIILDRTINLLIELVNGDKTGEVTVYTPEENSVHAYQYDYEPRSWWDLWMARRYVNNNYPNATIVGDPTGKYNCHSYAWHDQLNTNNKWINAYNTYYQQYCYNENIHKYWNDCSYLPTNSTASGVKVSYGTCGDDDHSAIRTSDNKVISKWGYGCLVKHDISYCPYNSDNLSYYIRPDITGPSIVCTSNTIFTLNNAPSSSNVSWSVTPSNQVTPYSGNGTSATFHSTCSNIGDGHVMFTVSSTCGSTHVSKTFLAGGPDASDVSLVVLDNQTGQEVDPMFLCLNTLYNLYYDNNSSCNTSNYSWTLPYGMTLINTSQNWALINTNSSSGGMLMVHGQTCCTGCGSNVLFLTDVLATNGYDCGGGWYMSFAPNPATDETVLELKTDHIDKYTEGAEWEMEIYNQQLLLIQKTRDLKDKKHIINTSGWKEGVYFVRVKLNNNIFTGKFVVAR